MNLENEARATSLVVRADALDLPLPDASVDLVITSPPYFALRSYRDEGEHYAGQIGSEDTPQQFLEALWAATREMVRVLKPSGSIWVNLGDKYAGSGMGGNGNKYRSEVGSGYATKAKGQTYGIPAKSLMGLPWRYAIGCIDDLGLILRAEVVWSKPNGLPESVIDRVRRSHEQWFHFTKEPRYFSALDEIREPHLAPWKNGSRDVGSLQDHEKDATAGRRGISTRLADEREYNPLGKLPGSVWTIPSEPLKVPEHLGVDHFAAFPQEWPRRIILGWSPSGVCVECGAGRVPVVEKRLVNPKPNRRADYRRNANTMDGGSQVALSGNQEATITGYACACPEPTADTRPAVVLDPFGGTGTVAMVARSLGRVGISVDLSLDYCRLAEWRIFHSGHGAKTLRKTWAERQEGLAI